MSNKYRCKGCKTTIVLVESGGVARQLICTECGHEMDFEEHVNTEWVSGPDVDKECDCDYHIADGRI